MSEKRSDELRRGEVDPKKLTLKRTMTKEIGAYNVQTRTATAARQLEGEGVRVRPGEAVRYVLTNARAKDKSIRVKAEEIEPGSGYDAGEYVKMLEAACMEVVALYKLGERRNSASTNDQK